MSDTVTLSMRVDSTPAIPEGSIFAECNLFMNNKSSTPIISGLGRRLARARHTTSTNLIEGDAGSDSPIGYIFRKAFLKLRRTATETQPVSEDLRRL